jgi:hypothetical protein
VTTEQPVPPDTRLLAEMVSPLIADGSLAAGVDCPVAPDGSNGVLGLQPEY